MQRTAEAASAKAAWAEKELEIKNKENEEWTGMVARHVASLCQAREENAAIRAADAEKGEKLKEQDKTIRDQAYKLEISGIVRLGICASSWDNGLT